MQAYHTDLECICQCHTSKETTTNIVARIYNIVQSIVHVTDQQITESWISVMPHIRSSPNL